MKKFLIVFFSIFLLLILAIFILPIVYKGKVVSLLQQEINKNVNAKISFDEDIELSLIKSFPNLTLGINKFQVIGVNEFEQDTLTAIDKFSCTLDIMSVIKGDVIGVKKIYLENPLINAIVLKDGKANWDITKPSTDTIPNTDTTETKFKVSLKSLEIKNGKISYDDKKMGVNTLLNGFDFQLSGDFTQDEFLLSILSEIKEFSLAYGGAKYLNKVNTSIKVDMDMNMPQMKYTFKENSIELNELVFNFDGFVQMLNDDILMDLKYDAPKASFKSFLSLVPGMYTKDFADLKTKGLLGFNGTVKGKYNESSLPAFTFNLNIADAMFQYPALPVPVNDVQVNLQISNPDGNLNNTRINLNKFHLDIAGDAIDAKLLALNVMKDPEIDAWLKGKFDLGNISKFVPLENDMKLSGVFTSDITAKGKISAIEQKKFNEFNATGKFVAQQVQVQSKDLPHAFELSNAGLNFTPEKVALTAFDAKIGQSDFSIKGDISNFFPYLFSNGIIQGNLALNSTLINANEFITQDESPAAPPVDDTTSLEAPIIPDNINFTFNSSIKKLLYSNFEIENFNGNLNINQQKLNLSNVGLNMLGSVIKMSGFYETSNSHKPTASFNFSLADMDMQMAAKTFNTIKKLAPIIEKSNGTFSANFSLQTALDKHLNIIYPDLFSNGTLVINKAEIKNVRLMEEVAKVLKDDKYKALSMKKVKIDFKVENGRVYTQPFNTSVAGTTLTLAGSSGLDQTIDYTGTTVVSRGQLGKVNSALEDALKGVNSKVGSNIKMSENIPLALGIKGTFTKPIITTNLADIAKQEANSLKNQAKEELDKQKKILEDKVNAEKERLKAEALAKQKEIEAKAKAEVESAKQKAQAEADRIKKEAEAKAQAEKERLKKQAEEEAKKKLKGIFKP